MHSCLFPRHGIVRPSKPHILLLFREIPLSTDASSTRPSVRQRRQQQTRQHRDDRDHHQQLDQREGAFILISAHCPFSTAANPSPLPKSTTAARSHPPHGRPQRPGSIVPDAAAWGNPNHATGTTAQTRSRAEASARKPDRLLRSLRATRCVRTHLPERSCPLNSQFASPASAAAVCGSRIRRRQS